MENEKKTYKYWKVGEGNGPKEYIEKTEDQLDEKEMSLFYGELLHTFNTSPSKVQERFIHELVSSYRVMNNMVEKVFKEEYEKTLNTILKSSNAKVEYGLCHISKDGGTIVEGL